MMKVIDVVRHPRVDYSAKDFDSQQGYMLRVEISPDVPVEVGIYLHWQRGRPIDIAIDVSCMSGCTEKCKFCAAATVRDVSLDVDQIVEQVDLALAYASANHTEFMQELGSRPKVTVSFEGMGEPSRMPETVVAAIDSLRSRHSESTDIQFIVSTLAADPAALGLWADRDLRLQTLQVSLHGADADTRRQLLLQNVDLSNILSAIDDFASRSPDTEIKVNYVLVSGRNDSVEAADTLCALLGDRPYYLKIARMNETDASRTMKLSRPSEARFREFLDRCVAQRPPGRTYPYGSETRLNISCGQLASYARRTISDGDLLVVRQVYQRILEGNTVLFLGAGASSTVWGARGLAQKLYDGLDFKAEFSNSGLELPDVADIYSARDRRQDVHRMLRQRLDGADYPDAYRLLTQFPWKAIFTTNYDEFVERAYADAAKEGLTDYRCVPIRETKDLCRPLGEGQVPLVKLHGCVSRDATNQVISGSDYLAGYMKEREFLFKYFELEALRSDIVFAGYSFRDQYLGQLIHSLKEAAKGAETAAFAVLPRSERTPDLTRVLRDKFRINLVAAELDDFTAELCRLARMPVVLVSGSSRKVVPGTAFGTRSDLGDKMTMLAKELGEHFTRENVRIVNGATSTDKFGFMVARHTHEDLRTTYKYDGVENDGDSAIGDEVSKMVGVRMFGESASDVVDKMVTMAQAAVFAGGSRLALEEFNRASSKGLLVIPVALGDRHYTSDVIHSYLTGNAEVIGALDADYGYRKKEGRPNVTARFLTRSRLANLRLDLVGPTQVAKTIMEILRAFRMSTLG